MRKITLTLTCFALLSASCSKEKECECVTTYSDEFFPQTTQTATIEEGECDDYNSSYEMEGFISVTTTCKEI